MRFPRLLELEPPMATDEVSTTTRATNGNGRCSVNISLDAQYNIANNTWILSGVLILPPLQMNVTFRDIIYNI